MQPVSRTKSAGSKFQEQSHFQEEINQFTSFTKKKTNKQ